MTDSKKLTKRELVTQDFRTNRPYCVEYDAKYYYFLNRHYKQLGKLRGRWQDYPDISEGKRLYFYNDATNPFGYGLKRVPGIRLLREYEGRLADFMKLAKANGLAERTDFRFKEAGAVLG